MNTLYNLLVYLATLVLPIIALFNKKINAFVAGRKATFELLNRHFTKNDAIYWFHVASLGEYEQALPVLLKIKEKEPDRKILISFFSPSGYLVKKHKTPADLEIYLPLDTRKNASLFFSLVHIEKAFFVKYELWPNFLEALQKRKIKTYLLSGLFRKNQVYFKPWGGFFRKALTRIDYFFVQTQTAKELLNKIGFTNVDVSGDTRYDRVSQQLKMNNRLDFIEEFLGENKCCFVFGSTWPEDEAIFIDFINQHKSIKYIIAPHEISKANIQKLTQKLTTKTVLFSTFDKIEAKDAPVLIVDSVGMLSKIYAYASIAYVGGGMGNAGLHNILEPATFGVPVIIGKNYNKFPEALELEAYAGLFSVYDATTFSEVANKLINNHAFRQQTGMIAGHFIQTRTGATEKIMHYLYS